MEVSEFTIWSRHLTSCADCDAYEFNQINQFNFNSGIQEIEVRIWWFKGSSGEG